MLERNGDWETSYQLRNEPVTQQVVRLHLFVWVGLHLLDLAAVDVLFAEADLSPARTRLDDFLQTVERPAADEQDVLRVDLDILLLRMFAPALRGDRRNSSF